MSRRPPVGREHERARQLAALALDEALPAADAAWLAAHLSPCDACRSVAAEYADGRNALRSLRGAAMEPPRNLWARTASQIEAEAARRPRPSPSPRRTFAGRLPLGAFAPLAALLVVAIAVGAGLFNGTSLLPQSTAAMPTPIAITAAADVQVLSRSEDGSVQILSRPVNAVCPVGSSECGVTRTFAVTSVGGVGKGSLNASMSPHRDRLVVVASSNGTQGVYVLPVGIPTPVPSASTRMSPFPASPVVVATSTPAHASTTPDATASPSATPDLSASPTSSPSIPVSPEPGGVLEIASNVVVVGPAAYSPDGTQVAFSARPADGSAGPDVYLWTSGDAVARALTTDHGAQFASWTTAGILVSRVADGTPATTLLNPATGAETPVAIGAAWLPVVDPTGTVSAWWAGTLKRNDTGDWVPNRGSLVIGKWPAGAGAGSVQPTPEPTSSASRTPPAQSSTGESLPAPTGAAVTMSAPPPSTTPSASTAPSAAAPTSKPAQAAPTAAPSVGVGASASPSPSSPPEGVQVLTHGSLTAWSVRWDETGTAMAVWTLGAAAAATAGSSAQPGATASGAPVASAGASDAPRASPPATPSATLAQAPDVSHISVDGLTARSGDPIASDQPVASLPAESAATGTPAPTSAGRLSLYRVSPETRLADLEHPMLDAAPADGGFSLRTGRLAWTSRPAAGELLLQVVAWSGDAIGRLELPAAAGAMIVP